MVWKKTAEVYRKREMRRILRGFASCCGPLYTCEDCQSQVGGLLKHYQKLYLTMLGFPSII